MQMGPVEYMPQNQGMNQQEEMMNQYMSNEAGPLMHMMDTFPHPAALMGAMTHRGANTIIGGGWSSRPAGEAVGFTGYVREGFRQRTGSPRAFNRYATQSIFHGTGPSGFGGRYGYTPYGGALFANAIGRGITGTAQTDMGRRVSSAITSSGPGQAARNALQSKGLVNPDAGNELVSRGFTSRVSAGAKIGSMHQNAFASRAQNMEQFLRHAHRDGPGTLRAQNAAQRVVGQGQTATAQAVMMSGQGTMTGRMGGYMAGAARGTTGLTASTDVLEFASDQARQGFSSARADAARLGVENQNFTARQAVREGMRNRAAGGMGAGLRLGGARLASLGARFIPVAGQALLAYDLARMATRGAGAAARGFSNAIEDVRESAGLQNRMLERSFQDTEMTMTNRQRASQAIQNSRLNARSALGAEAGTMAAHFG